MYENGLRGWESDSFFCHTLSGVMCVPFLLYTPKCHMSHTWSGGWTFFPVIHCQVSYLVRNVIPFLLYAPKCQMSHTWSGGSRPFLLYTYRCQTYEGGFAGFPGQEAHGGYSFCGLAALVILNKPELCDLPRLLVSDS